MQAEVVDSPTGQQSTAVDLKGSVFTLPILQIRSTSIDAIKSELQERLKNALKFFENAPIVIDLEKISTSENELNFAALMQLMSKNALIPVGVRNGSSQQNALAVSAGLAILKDSIMQDAHAQRNQPNAQQQTEDPGPGTSTKTASTRVITTPVRSGQQIYAKGTDLIVLASVNPGAEIIADGNIHVYAPMRGRALAGVRGDGNAKIFCQSMEAELISIAGNFRVFEEKVPVNIRSKTVQIFLEGERLMISPLK